MGNGEAYDGEQAVRVPVSDISDIFVVEGLFL
jgi:hypothetical protein